MCWPRPSCSSCVTTDDVGDTLDYDPVFASLSMSLQAQSRARFYFEHFYLEAWPLFQNFVAAPRSFIEFAH